MGIIIGESTNDITQQELTCIEFALRAIDELHEAESEKDLSCVQKTIYEETFRFGELENRYKSLIDQSKKYTKTYKRELNNIGFSNVINHLLSFELIDPCGYVDTASTNYNDVVVNSFEKFKGEAPSLRGLRKTYANFIELFYLPSEEIIRLGFTQKTIKRNDDLLVKVAMEDILSTFEYAPSKKYYTYQTRKILMEVNSELTKMDALLGEVEVVEKRIYANMLTIIAILVAVFSIIGLNTTAMLKNTVELSNVIYLNIALIIALTWMFALVDRIVNVKPKFNLLYAAGGSIGVSIALLLIDFFVLN